MSEELRASGRCLQQFTSMTSSVISLLIKRVASLRTVYYLIDMHDSALVYDLKVRHLLFPVAPLRQPNQIRGTGDSLIITEHNKAEFYDEYYNMLFSRVETAAGACERMGERSWSSYHRHVQYVLGESFSAGTERVSLLSCNPLIRSHLQLHTFLRLHLRELYPPLMLVQTE